MNDDDLQQDELQTLKARADKLDINYHPSIGADKLKDKINAKLEGGKQESAPTQEAEPKKESDNAFRLRKRKEADELVRIQITCMNPNKAEWEGEIFCAGNTVVGTFKKYVPYNVEWHVPRIIFNQIKQRQCQIFVTKKDERGRSVREGKLIREFNVAELNPLTEKELKELSQRQAMAAGQA